MSRVPDTNTFSLQNVVDVVIPATPDLIDSYSYSILSYFDARYSGDTNSLYNFRNYGYEPGTSTTTSTTTTSTTTSSTTTTTTSTTTTTICQRPVGLNDGKIISTCANLTDPVWIFYNVSAADACSAFQYFRAVPNGAGTQISYQEIQYDVLAIGEPLYVGLSSTDCSKASFGYYWFQPDTSNSIDYFKTINEISIVTVEGGVITAINTCTYTTTTTSTTTSTTSTTTEPPTTTTTTSTSTTTEPPTTTTTSTTSTSTSTTTTKAPISLPNETQVAIYNTWTGVGMTCDGSKQVACALGERVWGSIDYGQTWTTINNTVRNYRDIAINSDGSIILTCVTGGYVYKSTDFGQNWSEVAVVKNWNDIAISSDNTYALVVSNLGDVYLSTNGGSLWNSVTYFNSISNVMTDVSVSSSGQHMLVCSSSYNGTGSGYIYLSTDYGVSWTTIGTLQKWNDLAISDNGQIIIGVTSDGLTYLSTNGGSTMTLVDTVSGYNWRGIDMTPSGDYIIRAGVLSSSGVGQFSYSDDGNTWNAISNTARNWNDIVVSCDNTYKTAVVYNGNIYTFNDTAYPTTTTTSTSTTSTTTSTSTTSTTTSTSTTSTTTSTSTTSTTEAPLYTLSVDISYIGGADFGDGLGGSFTIDGVVKSISSDYPQYVSNSQTVFSGNRTINIDSIFYYNNGVGVASYARIWNGSQWINDVTQLIINVNSDIVVSIEIRDYSWNTTTSTTTTSTTSTTTTTTPPFATNHLIYNYYSVVNNNITAEGWFIPSETIYSNIVSYLGGYSASLAKLKSTTSWDTAGNNSSGFNAKPNGGCAYNPSYTYGVGVFMLNWTVSAFDSTRAWHFGIQDTAVWMEYVNKWLGGTIRAYRTTSNPDGTLGVYYGNDGKAYQTVAIGGIEITTQDLDETLYRDGSPVPYISDGSVWYNNGVAGLSCSTYYIGVATTSTSTTSTTTSTTSTSTTTTSSTIPCSEDISYEGAYSGEPIVYNIDFGLNNGLYVLEYQNQIIADKIEIYQNGVLKDYTNGEVSYGSNRYGKGGWSYDIDKRPLRFLYNSSNGRFGQIKIMTSDVNTIWRIYSHCPIDSDLNTLYSLNDVNYSYLFDGLSLNTNYKLIIDYPAATYPIPVVYYTIWNASGMLNTPALPILYGDTSGGGFTSEVSFNTGSANGVVIDIVRYIYGTITIKLIETTITTTTTTTTTIFQRQPVVYYGYSSTSDEDAYNNASSGGWMPQGTIYLDSRDGIAYVSNDGNIIVDLGWYQIENYSIYEGYYVYGIGYYNYYYYGITTTSTTTTVAPTTTTTTSTTTTVAPTTTTTTSTTTTVAPTTSTTSTSTTTVAPTTSTTSTSTTTVAPTTSTTTTTVAPEATARLMSVTIGTNILRLNVTVSYTNPSGVDKNMRIRVMNITQNSSWIQGIVHTIYNGETNISYLDILNMGVSNYVADSFSIELSTDGGSTWTGTIYHTNPLILPYDELQ